VTLARIELACHPDRIRDIVRGEGQAMPEHIAIRPAHGRYVVRAGGAIIGETSQALEVTEGNRPPVIYVPRKDVAMALLDRTEQQSACPLRGTASYFSLVTPAARLENAALSYEAPRGEAKGIAGYMAFQSDQVTVEPR
jgi:uncharacterized protein (DUF427 family)